MTCQGRMACAEETRLSPAFLRSCPPALPSHHHRVWGGGIWEPRAFFDAADEFGILLYTDQQFTWGSVKGTPSEAAELDYQLKRLSHQ